MALCPCLHVQDDDARESLRISQAIDRELSQHYAINMLNLYCLEERFPCPPTSQNTRSSSTEESQPKTTMPMQRI